jgi:hypothetical protein
MHNVLSRISSALDGTSERDGDGVEEGVGAPDFFDSVNNTVVATNKLKLFNLPSNVPVGSAVDFFVVYLDSMRDTDDGISKIRSALVDVSLAPLATVLVCRSASIGADEFAQLTEEAQTFYPAQHFVFFPDKFTNVSPTSSGDKANDEMLGLQSEIFRKVVRHIVFTTEDKVRGADNNAAARKEASTQVSCARGGGGGGVISLCH